MKTLILTHSDCDGICAGAIALAKFPDAKIFFTKPVSFYEDLKRADADRFVIADIAISKNYRLSMPKLMRKKKHVLYFDHHPLPNDVREMVKRSAETFVHNEDASSSELIFKYFQKEIPKESVWVAIYGAIGDYTEETGFVKESILNWDRRALYFEVSTLVLGIKNKEFESYDAKRKIVDHMSKGRNPSDIQGLVKSAKDAVRREFDLYNLVKKIAKKSGKVGYVENIQHFGFRGPAALFAATVTNTPVGLCVYRRASDLDITMRQRDYKIPLNSLAETAADQVGGSGGGHLHAAGARIPLGAFEMFLKKLNEMIG